MSAAATTPVLTAMPAPVIDPSLSPAEKLAAAQALLAKIKAEKEAAKIAAAAEKEAKKTAKEAAKAAKEAEKAAKAALPKRPVGRPRKNPASVASDGGSATPAPLPPSDSATEASSTAGSDHEEEEEEAAEPPVATLRVASTTALRVASVPLEFAPLAAPATDAPALAAELAATRMRLAAVEAAYARDHALLQRLRALLADTMVV